MTALAQKTAKLVNLLQSEPETGASDTRSEDTW